MSNSIRIKIIKKVEQCLNAHLNSNAIPFFLSLKVNKSNGTYSFSLPLTSKYYDIKNEVANITNDLDIFDNITVDKNTLNYNLSRKQYIKEILQSNCHNVLPPYINNYQKIVVEFSSPNIAKPFHLGHLRSTIIGNYVANINDFLQHHVKKINYLGDWGTQFGLIQVGINKANVNEKELKTNPIKTLYNAYVIANKLAETDPTIKEQAKEIFKQLELKGSSEEWETFKKYTIQELKMIYNKINISFDEYHWESMYSANNLKNMLTSMEQMKLLTIDNENKKVISLEPGKNVPILKSDGSTLYITRDIAAAIDRFEKDKFDCMYYVVDNSQTGHFLNLIEILKKMNMPWADKLKHVKFGRIHGMSTRKGTAVFLDDMLDEMRNIMKDKQIESPTTKVLLNMEDNSAEVLAISAMIINDLKQRRQKDYTLNWETALDVKGDTGVKLQYTHCRLMNLQTNFGSALPLECDPTVLNETVIDDLVTKIGIFDETVLKSYKEFEPCILVNYLFQLSSHSINKAFNVLIVRGKPTHIADQRLLLFHVAKNVLAQGMQLLGITVLHKM